MTSKFIIGILGGVVVGSAFGAASGNTGIAIAVCVAAGALSAGVWHYLEHR